jgi:two-component system LytT family sensor kinase
VPDSDPLLLPDAALRRVVAGFALAWTAFWVLMILVAVQDHLRDGGHDLWRPLVSEGSSMLVATAVALAQWRLARRLDGLLDQPLRWFAHVFAWLPGMVLFFIAAAYGLRHGVYGMAGRAYEHEPWTDVVVYETIKFSVFYLLFTTVHFGLRSYLAWSGERLRAERHLALSRQAQLLQLTQQIQPHFLFNALNTVSSLIHTDPDLADALLTRLATLLRAATDAAQRPQQPLADELTLLEAYAAIMSERFADRVRVHWDVADAARRCPVPTLGLQPLLENCFRHVVEPRRAMTEIVIRAACQAGRVVIEVADDGGVLAGPARFGIGLGNLRQRLQALHGDEARLSLDDRPGGGVVARMELPCAC